MRWQALVWLACASCSSSEFTEPVLPAVQRIVIETGMLSAVEVPLRGRTQVVVFARAADGTIVRDVPVPELISRDTTRFVVEPGLWVRSVGTGGSTTLVARLVLGGRTFLDSARVGTVIPLN